MRPLNSPFQTASDPIYGTLPSFMQYNQPTMQARTYRRDEGSILGSIPEQRAQQLRDASPYDRAVNLHSIMSGLAFQPSRGGLANSHPAFGIVEQAGRESASSWRQLPPASPAFLRTPSTQEFLASIELQNGPIPAFRSVHPRFRIPGQYTGPTGRLPSAGPSLAASIDRWWGARLMREGLGAVNNPNAERLYSDAATGWSNMDAIVNRTRRYLKDYPTAAVKATGNAYNHAIMKQVMAADPAQVLAFLKVNPGLQKAIFNPGFNLNSARITNPASAYLGPGTRAFFEQVPGLIDTPVELSPNAYSPNHFSAAYFSHPETLRGNDPVGFAGAWRKDPHIQMGWNVNPPPNAQHHPIYLTSILSHELTHGIQHQQGRFSMRAAPARRAIDDTMPYNQQPSETSAFKMGYILPYYDHYPKTVTDMFNSVTGPPTFNQYQLNRFRLGDFRDISRAGSNLIDPDSFKKWAEHRPRDYWK